MIRVKDDPRSIYLLVRGFKNDDLRDFKSFQPKQTRTGGNDYGVLVGRFGEKDASEVRLSITKGRSLPLLDIRNLNGMDTSVTSVVYCDSVAQMKNVHNFI